jgi:type IV fimbrial biogenesis protein FimT
LRGGFRESRQQNPDMDTRQGSRGITLIELCFALAVVAILAGLAVPGMRAALREAAVRSATLELLTGLQQTRTGSIAQSRPGVFCLSDAEGRCLAGTGTALAWAAFLEGRGGTTALAGGPLPRGLELRATRARLSFWPDSLAATPSTLTICDRAGFARPRALVISQSGRVRLADAAASACRA